MFYSGFIAIVGLPNAGKSTLLNSLLQQKVAIVTNKPQTTRSNLQGVLTEEDMQMVFIDTPGVQEPRNKLGQVMEKSVRAALVDVDVILFVVDGEYGLGEKERGLLQAISGKAPVVLAINKCDALTKEQVMKRITQASTLPEIKEIVPISAREGQNLDELKKVLRTFLKEGPKYYPDDMVTDQPERLIAAELIREKAMNLLRDELPHGIGVEIMQIENQEDQVHVLATVYCEKESHKGMIIGKNASVIKEIGVQARWDLQKLFDQRVYLELYVKVVKDWRNKSSVLHDLGFLEK